MNSISYSAIALFCILVLQVSACLGQLPPLPRYGVYSVLSTNGGSAKAVDYYFRSTVGQSSPTSVFQTRNFQIRQGFQQPRGVYAQNINIEEIEFNLFPNPNSGHFSIELLNAKEPNIRFSIRDMAGRVICAGYGQSDITNNVVLPVVLPVGVYSITLIGERMGNAGHKRFVVAY